MTVRLWYLLTLQVFMPKKPPLALAAKTYMGTMMIAVHHQLTLKDSLLLFRNLIITGFILIILLLVLLLVIIQGRCQIKNIMMLLLI